MQLMNHLNQPLSERLSERLLSLKNTVWLRNAVTAALSAVSLVGAGAIALPSLAQVQSQPLPRLVDRAVRRDAASRSTAQISAEQLQMIEYKAEIWPNSCLGLSSLDEVCSPGLVSGWRVVLADGIQTWIYRTNASGQNTRLEPVAAQPNVGDRPYNPRPQGRSFIGGDSTSTEPLPEEQQLPSAQLSPLGGQVRMTLVNRTGATVDYQVIGDTTQRQLGGQQSVTLRLLDIPTTVTFRRNDGGLLMVLTRVQSEAHSLEVFLDAAVDLSLDRTTLTVERDGSVFLN